MARRTPQAAGRILALLGRVRVAGAALAAGCGLASGCGDAKRSVTNETTPPPQRVVFENTSTSGIVGPQMAPRVELHPANSWTQGRTRELIQQYLGEERSYIARGVAEESLAALPVPVPVPGLAVELIREPMTATVELERSTPGLPPPSVTLMVERQEPVQAPSPRLSARPIESVATPPPVAMIAEAPRPRVVRASSEPSRLPMAASVTSSLIPRSLADASAIRVVSATTLDTVATSADLRVGPLEKRFVATRFAQEGCMPMAWRHSVPKRLMIVDSISAIVAANSVEESFVTARSTEQSLVREVAPASLRPFTADPLTKSGPIPPNLPKQIGAAPPTAKPSGLPKQAGYASLPSAASTGNKPPKTRLATAPGPAADGNKPPKATTPGVIQAMVSRAQVPEGVPEELLKPLAPKEDDGVVMVGGVSLTLPRDLKSPLPSEPLSKVEIVQPMKPVKPEDSRSELTKAEPSKVVAPKPSLGPVVGPVVGAMPTLTVEPGITLPVPPLLMPTSSASAAGKVPTGESPSLMLVAAPQPLPFPATLSAAPGSIDVGGVAMPFDSLTRMVEGQIGGCGGGGCATCGGGGCAPGRPCAAGKGKCEPFPAKTVFGRAIGLMYENLCCPDPCYQPKWEPITATAFFTDAPRPIAQSIIRWDWNHLALFPDRGEYLFARSDGKGKGLTPNSPARAIPDVDYHDLAVVTEVGKGAFSTTISVPYRSINPGIYADSAAGFSDMSITTKSLLFDSELFMLSFLLKTTLPAGNFRKGLGVGHVSLEPSVVAGLRFGPRTYGVAQIAEWVPIAGDPDYAGALLRWNFALNHVIWQPIRDVQIISTLEVLGFTFQDGAYTDPIFGSDQKLSGQTFVTLSPGARMFYCDKFDMGMAYAVGVTGKYFAHSQIRMEFRYRY